MGVIKSTFFMLFYTLAFTLFLMVVPGIPPHYNFEAYQLRPPRKLEGKLSPNDILDRAELVADGQFIGPESLAFKGDDVYTGVEGGDILKIDGKGNIQKVAHIEPTEGTCDDTWKSPCPRPLGLRFSRDESKLIVAVGYKGIVEVDVKTGASKVLLAVGTILGDGEPFSFPDDLDIDSDGMIYFSDASKTAWFKNVFPEAFGEPTGRLVKLDPTTGKTEVLVSGIHFANGVQLSRKEDFIVVAETARERIIKYHLKGPKKGVKETILEGLPGFPDNIRSNGKGGFYVSLVFPDTQDDPSPLRQFMPLPSVKKLILRVQYALLKVCEVIDTLLPNPITQWAHTYISVLGPFGDLSSLPKKVIIVDIDEEGSIIGSLHSNKGFIRSISQISLGERYTYFGSPYTDKLWRIKTEYLA